MTTESRPHAQISGSSQTTSTGHVLVLALIPDLITAGFLSDAAGADATAYLAAIPAPVRVGTIRDAMDWLIERGFLNAHTEAAATQRLTDRLDSDAVRIRVDQIAASLRGLDSRLDEAFARVQARRRRKARRDAVFGGAAVIALGAGSVASSFFSSASRSGSRRQRRWFRNRSR